MDLQTIKQQIQEAGFPKETTDAINNIIGVATARNGELTKEENEEIVNLIDDAIMKNEEETNMLLTAAETMQDIQDAFIEGVEEAKEMEAEAKEDEAQNQTDASTASAPTTPPNNPIT